MKTSIRVTALLLLLCFAPGCAGLLAAFEAMQAVDSVSRGAQWLGEIVNRADTGSDVYFARHPNPQREGEVRDAILRARTAVEALNRALASAEALEDGDVAAARREALVAYFELTELLRRLGVLSARAPLGGAESNTPEPKPLDLPLVAEVSEALSQ